MEHGSVCFLALARLIAILMALSIETISIFRLGATQAKNAQGSECHDTVSCFLLNALIFFQFL